MNENGYAVRGWLHSLVEGTAELDEVESMINLFIERASERGYAEGVRDEMSRWGRIATQRTVKGVLSVPANELRQSYQDATERARKDVHKWGVDND